MKHNIDTTDTVIKNSTETWVSKPKGMLQTIWGRRLLDVEIFCIEYFSAKSSNEFGNVIKATHLRPLLSSCPEFIEEESIIEKNIRKKGTLAINSPKYDCEIGVEGI